MRNAILESIEKLTFRCVIVALTLFCISFNCCKVYGEEFLENYEFLQYDQNKWNEIKEKREKVLLFPWDMKVSTGAARQAAKPPKKLEMPLEPSITINGQKGIGLRVDSTIFFYPNERYVNRYFNPQMTQDLVLGMQGKLGEKININIDYNDRQGTTPKQDISVSYRGDPVEFIQDVKFGDVTLSIPGSTFLGSYSRQVFGLYGVARLGNAKLTLAGSRTKGELKSKTFKGNQEFEKKIILDTGFVRNKYFKLTFDNDDILPQSEEIYLDDRRYIKDRPPTVKEMVVEDFRVPTSTYSGYFELLYRGVDYVVDYTRKIITFKRSISDSHVIAINYRRPDGAEIKDINGTGRCKIIKTENNRPIKSTDEIGWRQQLLNFYHIGRTKITRDNFRGNFILKICDDLQYLTEPAELKGLKEGVSKVVPRYPQQIKVDFENGVFWFEEDGKMIEYPFPEEAYVFPQPPPGYKGYYIYLEYHYRKKEFFLDINIVPQSEYVTVDGQKIDRDKYYIDYESGFFNFQEGVEIREDSVINITYEVAPLFGGGSDTIMAGNLQLPVSGNVNFGGSGIYKFSPSPLQVPELKNTTGSSLLGEVHGQIRNIKFPILPFTFSVTGEVAGSFSNPNTFGKALIDNMEGAKQIDSFPLSKNLWNPTCTRHFRKYSILTDKFYGREDQEGRIVEKGVLNNELVYLRDINPTYARGEFQTEERRQVLVINHDLIEGDEFAIVYPISEVGVDYSRKKDLEIWIYGDNSGAKLSVAFGLVSEDSDGDGLLDTEDKIIRNGRLDIGEDTGWEFNNANGTKVFVGKENNLLDGEDLDKDGILDTAEDIVEEYETFIDVNTGEKIDNINWSGWKMLATKLNIKDAARWSSIKHIRININRTDKSKITKIGYIALVGNKWEDIYVTENSTLTVSAVNNEDNPDVYKPITSEKIYEELYPQRESQIGFTSLRRREQALSLNYTLREFSTATVRTFFRPARDFSKYGKLCFFLYPVKISNPSATPVFFIQIGKSDSEYFEHRAPIDWANAWKMQVISLRDENPHDFKPDGFEIRVGSPVLTNIVQLKFGLYNPSKETISGEIWVNEIFVDDVIEVSGLGTRIDVVGSIPGWMNVSVKYKEVQPTFDPSFESATRSMFNQSVRDRSVGFSFNRLKFLQLNTNASWTTQKLQRSVENPYASERDEGETEKMSLLSDVILRIPGINVLNFQYGRNVNDLEREKRVEEVVTYSGNMGFTLPNWLWIDILPTKWLTFRPLPRSLSLSYTKKETFLRPYLHGIRREFEENDFLGRLFRRNIFSKEADGEDPEPFNFYDLTDNVRCGLEWEFFPNFRFSPTYVYSNTYQKHIYDVNKATEIPHQGISQQINATTSLNLLGINPTLNYSFASNENVPDRNKVNLKNVTRTTTAKLSFSAPLGKIANLPLIGKIFAPIKDINIHSSFDIKASDVYEQIPTTVTVQEHLWVKEDKELYYRGRKKFHELRSARFSQSRFSPLSFLELPKKLNFLTFLKKINIDCRFDISEEKALETGTRSRILRYTWPDINIGTSNIESILLLLNKYVTNFDMNFRTRNTFNEKENSEQSRRNYYELSTSFYLFKKFTPYFNISDTEELKYKYIKDVGKFSLIKDIDTKNISFNIGIPVKEVKLNPTYTLKITREEDVYGEKRETRSHTKVHTLSMTMFLNIRLPAKLSLPFSKKIVSLPPGQQQFTLHITPNYTRSETVGGIGGQESNYDAISLGLNTSYAPLSYLYLNAGCDAALKFYRRASKENNPSNFNFSMRMDARITF